MTRAEPGRRLVMAMAPTLAALPPAQARLAGFLREAGAAERTVGRAELLLEELVTNVISHGDLAAEAADTLSVEAVIGPSGDCSMTFEDPGAPFDPLAATLPDRPSRIEDARIGGLGLVLLRRMARDLRYVRLPEGRNRLTFTLDGPAGA